MSPIETIQIPVTVTVSKAAYDRLLALVGGDMPPAHKIASVVDGLVSDLSDGGMMLSGTDMERIHTALPEAGPDEIIGAVEESVGMEDGIVVVKWAVDNTMLQPMQQVADQQGRTVQECVQNLMDTAVNNGWFYDLLLSAKALWVEPAQYAKLKEITGLEEVTGADLMKYLEDQGLTQIPLDQLFAEDQPEDLAAEIESGKLSLVKV